MDKILIVEEDFTLAQKLCESFTDKDMEAISCGSIQTALALVSSEYFKMVILDEMLPDGNGIDYIDELKHCNNRNETSVIVLVPNEIIEDVVAAQLQGADDCISKPFSTAALKAKVVTLLRRYKYQYNFEASGRFDAIGSASIKGIRGEHMVAIDKYMFDFDRMEFRCMGEVVALNNTEQKLLRILIENKGVVLRRASLIDRMRSETHRFIDGKILADTVITLRDKLDAVDYIKTVYGIGYMWANRIEG